MFIIATKSAPHFISRLWMASHRSRLNLLSTFMMLLCLMLFVLSAGAWWFLDGIWAWSAGLFYLAYDVWLIVFVLFQTRHLATQRHLFPFTRNWPLLSCKAKFWSCFLDKSAHLVSNEISEAKTIHKKYANESLSNSKTWIAQTKSDFTTFEKHGLPTDDFKKILRVLE